MAISDIGGKQMLLDLIKKRYSVRSFKDTLIPEHIIDYIIEAGRISPSGGNEQAWKFGIITDKETITKISAAAYNQNWIRNAPMLIVLCTDIVEDERGARGIQIARYPEWKEEIMNMNKELYSKLNSEEHQTKIPGTHMVLAALEHDIYSTWVSYFKVDQVSLLLNLPSKCIPSEIIAFGYSDEEPIVRKKKNKEDIVFRF